MILFLMNELFSINDKILFVIFCSSIFVPIIGLIIDYIFHITFFEILGAIFIIDVFIFFYII